MGVMDAFTRDNEDYSLEIAEPNLIMSKDHFLRIRKKIGLIVSLNITKQTALTIVGSVEK